MVCYVDSNQLLLSEITGQDIQWDVNGYSMDVTRIDMQFCCP